MTQALDVQVRWLIRRDMPEVLRIERECFEFPLGEEDFMVLIRQRNCIAMVAEHDQQIVGHMVYQLQKTRLQLVTLAVGPQWQRLGVGRQMVGKLIGGLSHERRDQLWTEVRERNLDAQLFFRAQGFRAVCIARGEYLETDEDCYLMQYRLEEEPSPFIPRNRIGAFI
jgi:ribosomal-protein-alanine N-acetyltransferase